MYTAFTTLWGVLRVGMCAFWVDEYACLFLKIYGVISYWLRRRVCEYLDDLLLISESFLEHLYQLCLVLRRFKKQ